VALTDTLKRAPRWAWWTVGGVAVGGAAIKVWQDRAKPEGEDGPADPTATGGAVSVGGGAPGAGVIVPPVIIPAQDDGSSNFVPLLTAIPQVYSDVYGGAVGLIPELIDQAAHAGSPPPPGNIIINVPPNVPAPAPKKPSNAPIPGKCPPAFPHRNAKTQKCYKTCSHTECKAKRKYAVHQHCYRDGHVTDVSREYKGKC
jgi:hypothetical protein